MKRTPHNDTRAGLGASGAVFPIARWASTHSGTRPQGPAQAGVSHLWAAQPRATQRGTRCWGAGIVPVRRSPECWGIAPCTCEKQHRPLEPASDSGPNLRGRCFYKSACTGCGKEAGCGGWGLAVLAAGAGATDTLEPSCGRCVPAVLSPVLSGHQVRVRRRSEARVSQDIPGPVSESPGRNKAAGCLSRSDWALDGCKPT